MTGETTPENNKKVNKKEFIDQFNKLGNIIKNKEVRKVKKKSESSKDLLSDQYKKTEIEDRRILEDRLTKLEMIITNISLFKSSPKNNKVSPTRNSRSPKSPGTKRSGQNGPAEKNIQTSDANTRKSPKSHGSPIPKASER